MELEQKSLAVTNYETNKTPGEFIADVAVFGNVDRVGDRIMPDAFAKAIAEDPPPPVVYNHIHDTPPMGETIEWEQIGQKSLRIKGALFVDGDDDHPVARMAYAGMKSRGGRPPALRDFSFIYGVPAGASEVVREGAKAVRNLHEVRPVAEVGPCLRGVNPLAGIVMAPKAMTLEPKVALTEADIAELPAKSFLHVDGDDRQYPYRDAKGAIDIARLHEATGAKSDELPAETMKSIRQRAGDLLALEQSKSLVKFALEQKAWDDIDSFCVSQLLDMLDEAVSYIQNEDDPANVTKLQGVARTLLDVLNGEFAELGNGADDPFGKSLWLTCNSSYVKACKLSSDADVTVTPVHAASLLLLPVPAP